GVLELRAIGNNSHPNRKFHQTEVGFFNEVEKLIEYAHINHAKRALYICLNLRQRELLHAQPANTLQRGDGGKNVDVISRSWLGLDIDTVRPNKRVAATDQEI